MSSFRQLFFKKDQMNNSSSASQQMPPPKGPLPKYPSNIEPQHPNKQYQEYHTKEVTHDPRRDSTGLPNGQLYVKVVEARDLLVKNSQSKPYCVVEFEKNEFVTREAIKTAIGTNSDGEMVSNSVWNHDATFDVSSVDGEVTVSIWDRSVKNSEEHFLGMMRIRPPHDHGKPVDNWFRLLPRHKNEVVKGALRLKLMYKKVASKPLTASDF